MACYLILVEKEIAQMGYMLSITLKAIALWTLVVPKDEYKSYQ